MGSFRDRVVSANTNGGLKRLCEEPSPRAPRMEGGLSPSPAPPPPSSALRAASLRPWYTTAQSNPSLEIALQRSPEYLFLEVWASGTADDSGPGQRLPPRAIPGQLGGVRCSENLVSRVRFSTGLAVGQVVLSSRRASRNHVPDGQCVSSDQTHVPFMASILCPYVLCVFSCVPEIL